LWQGIDIYYWIEDKHIVIRKGEIPDLDGLEDIAPMISVYYKFTQLKRLYRQGWLQAGVSREQCETVAEHSLGVVLLTALLGQRMKEKKGFDFEKALLMALFHDFGETYAGDFTPMDQISSEKKHALELDAVQRVFEGLDEQREILALWEEYEAGETAEAKFVKELDRLEMGLQASVYQRLGLLKLPEGFIASMTHAAESSELRKIAKQVEAVSQRG
jgi:5'-deoxynucleotidase YfbR-like HD superfamily hydrolase